VKTTAVIFPFDLFGGGGAAAGATLLADAIREMLDDNDRERVATRARCYSDRVRLKEFSFLTLAAYEDWRGKARQAIQQVWKKNDFLLWIAGNHLGVLPVYDELGSDAKDTVVIQFDAHLDVYNLSDCTAELSHGNFLLHSASPLPPIVNLGHRELLLRREYIRKHYSHQFSAAELAIGPEPALAAVRERCKDARRVFLDLDCDVLDPAFFPALGHPLPFGISPPLMLRLLDAAWSDKVVGMSISEFDPARDQNDRSLGTLIWLVEYLLLKCYEGESGSPG
jgi:arginase family enzyme